MSKYIDPVDIQIKEKWEHGITNHVITCGQADWLDILIDKGIKIFVCLKCHRTFLHFQKTN